MTYLLSNIAPVWFKIKSKLENKRKKPAVSHEKAGLLEEMNDGTIGMRPDAPPRDNRGHAFAILR